MCLLCAWVRWVVLRGNAISGVSLAAQNATRPAGQPAGCGSVVVNDAVANRPQHTSDVVAEHQTYGCPAGFLPGGTNLTSRCDHCRTRD